MTLKSKLALVTGIAFSGITLFFAFRNIPAGELVRYMKTVNYLFLIPGIIISLCSFVLRVIRWQWILKSNVSMTFSSLYHPLIIGYMINCILPGRVGEVARPMLLMKQEKVPFSTGLASIVCEKIFDLICLIFFLMISLSVIKINPKLTVEVGSYHLTGATLTTLGYSMAKLCLILVLGMVLISINSIRQAFVNLISSMPKLLIFHNKKQQTAVKEKLITPLSKMVDNFADGLVLLKSPLNIGVCLCLSLCIWAVQAGSYHVITLACPGVDLTYLQTMTMMVMICFFIALPSVPGYWGIWEAGGIFALTLFSVAGERAAGYTLINHAVQIFPIIIAGLISALMIGINFTQLFKQTPRVTRSTQQER